MTSAGVATVLKERVFFAKDCENCNAFSCDGTFDGFSKTLLRRVNESDKHVQILVLVSTRKLALQITGAMRKFTKPMSIKVHACIGGTSVNEEKSALASGAHIIVGTPGRVKHIISSRFLVLSALNLFVMYNFLPLLNMKEDLSSIVTSLPEDIQKGKCVCTSSRPLGRRLMEQFCKEMSLCSFYCVSGDAILQRDVPKPESGIDDGGKAMDDGGEDLDCKVFFAKDCENCDAFLCDCTFDGFLKTLLRRVSERDEHVQILVLVSTRELALQITRAMKKFAKPMSIKVHACIGGTSVNEEKSALASGAHIIVGTPGRVKHIISSRFLVLSALNLFVMYNFLPLLNMKEDLSSIVTSLPEDIQKGKCVCTSSRPHGQRLMEQFCKEMSLCHFYGVSDDAVLERDVSTPESGIDDGGKAIDDGGEVVDCKGKEPLEDELRQTNSFVYIRHIMAAIQSVDVKRRSVQVLVIAPQIEGVKQISKELQDSLSSTKILVYGCSGRWICTRDYELSNNVHVLIAPPQRALYLLRRECIYTGSIRILVMVNADKLFCTGSKTLLHSIIHFMPKRVQCVMLSGKELIHASIAHDTAVYPYEKLARSEPLETVINRRRHICIEVQGDQQNEQSRDFCSYNVTAKKTQFEVICDLYPKLECKRTVIICKRPKKTIWIQEHLAARGYLVAYCVGKKTKKFREEMQTFESSPSGVVLIAQNSANLFRDKEISVIVNYEMPKEVRGYLGRVAPTDLEKERTVVNLIKNKREAVLMKKVQSRYGIDIEHFIDPHCISF
ncbi:unnamed protein product [Cylicocyclus nassatus]|uniref:Helicase ATP-binding domain-containing protein n=1 Tax=Cylicocyclus nassatus TaxID=53992 RepID=A0AA36M353_CYLNA|nr:unnamed protein product [Cylicocyclus nassatus]